MGNWIDFEPKEEKKTFDKLEDGWHDVVIEEASLSKYEGVDHINFKLRFLNNRVIFSTLYIFDKNDTKRKIAVNAFENLLKTLNLVKENEAGIDLDAALVKLFGMPVKVLTSAYTSPKTGKVFTNLKKFVKSTLTLDEVELIRSKFNKKVTLAFNQPKSIDMDTIPF